MSAELDRGLFLLRNLDAYESDLGSKEAIALARRWKRIDSTIRERARDWSNAAIEELSRMTCAEQLRCIAEYDNGEYSSVDGAVLGEDSQVWEFSGKDVALSPTMRKTLENSYQLISELQEITSSVDDFYKREAIAYQLTRIACALEAWSKTPKEMLNVPG